MLGAFMMELLFLKKKTNLLVYNCFCIYPEPMLRQWYIMLFFLPISGFSQIADCPPFMLTDSFPYGGIFTPFRFHGADFCMAVLNGPQPFEVNDLLADSSRYQWEKIDHNYSFEKSTSYWFKIDIVNHFDDVRDAWFWLECRGWKTLEVYAPNRSLDYNKQIVSPQQALGDKEIPFWMPFFETHLRSGNNTVFLHLTSIDPNWLAGKVTYPGMVQVDPSSFLKSLPTRTYFSALLHGILLIQFLFFAIIYLVDRDKTVLYLIIFLAGYALYDLHEAVFKEEFNPFYWSYESYGILFLRFPATWIFLFGLIKFSINYVELGRIFPFLSRGVNIFMFLFAIVSLIAYLNENTVYAFTGFWPFQTYRFFALIAFLLVIIIPFLALYHRQPNAAVLLIGTGTIAFSGIVGILMVFGILPYFLPYRDVFRLGIAFSMVLLAFGAGRRMLIHRRRASELEKAREIDELKTRFYTNISHEFRTPLTVINGLTEQIQGHEPEKELIFRNSDQLLNLVNNMLELSRFEAGQQSLNYKQGDILNYLRYVTESFHSLALNQKINLNFYTSASAIEMDYDPDKVLQILSNLISNALKFTPAYGKVLVHAEQISATKLPAIKAANALQLTVKDTGKGMAADQLPYIFDRYYQTEDHSVAGSGIGLALVRELVHLLKGEIQVESEEGQGTVFTLFLPIHHHTEKNTANRTAGSMVITTPRTPTPLPEQHSSADEEAPLLLIVEDNADVLHYLRSCLLGDYRLCFARDGKAGIAKALSEVPDIIISDVMMPEADGFELCRMLKKEERTSHIPIMLLTAKADMVSKLEGLEYGADAYLTKPFHRRELDIRLQKLLDLRRTLQEKYNQASFESETSTQREDAFVKKAKKIILDNLEDEDFGIEALATAVNFSSTHVYRKLKALTGKPTSHFIRQIRLQEAYIMITETDKNISEIAYAVGFKEVSYFSRLFSDYYGKTATEVQKEKRLRPPKP